MSTSKPTSIQKDVLGGKTAPGEDDFAIIKKRIFEGGEKIVKYIIEAKGRQPEIVVHCIARHADIMSVLKKADKGGSDIVDYVDLSHYDDLLRTSADDVRFFLGTDTSDQKNMWAILRRAMDPDQSLDDPDPKICPRAQKHSDDITRVGSEYFKSIARQAVSEANAFHFNELDGPGHLNAVREYGYFVPYLAAKQFVGIELPDKPSVLLKLFMWYRNKKQPGKVRLDGDLAPASQMLLWSHVVFGHLFANIGDRIGALNFAAPRAAKAFKRRISKCLKSDFTPVPGSLIDRLRHVRKYFADIDDKTYEKLVRNIVFEFSGAMQILVGTSFSNILTTIYEKDIGLTDFLRLLDDQGDIVLDEALRLNPTTTSLYRVAKEDFELHGHQIREGDHLCLMTGAACNDEEAFPNAREFIVDPDTPADRSPENYINFGPAETAPNLFNPTDGTHPCFGQYWARELLKSMLKGLSQFEDLQIHKSGNDVLSSFGSIPDAILATYKNTPVKKQNFVTICSEIQHDQISNISDIRDKIEKLDNPASPEIAKKIDKTGCIHFMSLNLVEGDVDKNEPCILFLELSVDGEKEDALKSLCSHIGEELLPIYEKTVHGNIDTSEQLFEHLADNSVEMIQSVWPQFYSGNWRNGLGFSGTPGLSIQQIKDEQVLAQFVQDQISKSTPLKTPQQIFEATRKTLLEQETGDVARAKSRWVNVASEPPIFSEVADSPWKSAWSKATLTINATPDIVKVWVTVLFFLIGGLIWNWIYLDAPLKSNAVDQVWWNFPSKLLPPDDATMIYISAWVLLTGVLMAFAFSIFVTWFSDAVLRRRAGRIGSIFAFIFFMVGFLALAPNTNDCNPSNLSHCTSPYIPVLLGNYLINSTIWVISLVATISLAAITFAFDRRSFWKSGSAFVAFCLMLLLILTVGDLQLNLLATGNEALKNTGWGFDGLTVFNRWDTATPLQMLFYPIVMSTIIAAAIFAFNASYPKFRLFTHRKVYGYLFAALALFFFITTFYSPTLPSVGQIGKLTLAYLLAVPATLIVIGALAAIIWALLRRSEARNTPVDEDPDVDTLKEMINREDINGAHNHMISVQTLLPEQWRIRFFLPLAFHIVLIVLLKNRFRPGFLAAVGTVHYARWIHIAKTNKLVFVSNYDGSWESYLEDFITKSATGMTGIWSNCIGFPRAKNLFFEGAVDGDRFKRWARKSMQPTSFWYSAYPNIGAQEIRRNSLIRDGLARISTPSDAEAWLDLLGSIPRPTFSLQSEKIQSLVFGASGNLKAGRCLIVKSRVEGGIDPYFRDWVLAIKDEVSFGDSPPQKQAMYVGFTGKGMGLLGCNKGLAQDPNDPDKPSPDCIKFPPAFLMGMDSAARASILGDKGASQSADWIWGNDRDPAHAVLLIYGESGTGNGPNAFEKHLDKQKTRLAEYRLDHTEINLKNLPEDGPLVEPFGYVDGISQPLVRGTRRAAQRANSIHAVNPGEFILGYKDNRDFYPPSPQVSAHIDEDNLLPAIARSQPQRYPRFQSDAEEKYRDLGRNGTFLVIRQLQQHVSDFKSAVKNSAAEYQDTEESTAEDLVKAKLMGRWPDGRSLIKRPVQFLSKEEKEDDAKEWVAPLSSRPPTKADNEFLYGKEDPQGHKCPFGSHIRRTNPRDGLDVENPDGLAIANRHRILRRGRVYENGDEEGTLFMCLNADIERQFEFIQQTWVNSCTFHGLTDEMDPIAGQGYAQVDVKTKKPIFKDDDFQFTIQDPDQPSVLKNLKPFVTVRGGGYFFVPGKDALEFIANSADNPLLAKCPDQKS